MSTDIAHYEPSQAGSYSAISGGQLDNFMAWSKAIAVGSVIPDVLRGKPADVLITVLHGLDLGLKPMQALNLVYVVKGRPSLSAEGMRALLLQGGHEFRVVSCDQTGAVVEGRRNGSDLWHRAEFTEDDRKAAKLSGANWDAYRPDMFLARATTRLCRRFFPDVTNGLPSVEELRDTEPETPRPTLAQVAATRDTEDVVDAVVVDDDAQREAVANLEHDFEAEARAADKTEDADYQDSLV